LLPKGHAPADALSNATVALYALPSAGVNFLYSLALVMYMNFATDVLGVAPGILGAIFFASKLWDAVSDPIAGFLSDRTLAKRGRRKSWLLASSVPLAVFSVAAWSPPAEFSGAPLIAWIAVAVIGFYTAYTLFDVPHMALGAELSHDRRARVRVFGVRQLVRTLGMFAAFGIGATLLEDLTTARWNAFALATTVGLLTALAILVAVVALPPERGDYAGRGAQSPIQALRDVWRNPHARVLLFVLFVESLATGGVGVLVPFVVRYVMKTPDLIAEMLLVYTLPAVVSIPFWMRLANHFDKRRLWLVAMGMSGVGFGVLCLVHEGSVWLMASGALVAGFASGCGNTLGMALKADVIDWDEHSTGERKEGAYFSAWAFVSKVAGGLMVGLVGVTLQGTGFEAGEEPSATARRAMLFLMGGVPLLGFAVGMAAFTRFRLSESEHARIRREIDARAMSGPERVESR